MILTAIVAAAAVCADGHSVPRRDWADAKSVAAESASQPGAEPWKTNRPIVTVRKQLYEKHPRPRTATVVAVGYVGPKLELVERRAQETKDDVWDANLLRWSQDNGRTWSDFVKEAESTNVMYAGVTVWEAGACRRYDPASGRLVEMWLRQIPTGAIFNNFTYIRTSLDFGRTWSEPEQLRYEDGAPFDPTSPLKPAFLRSNQCMPGNSIVIRHDGALVCPVAHANAHDAQNHERVWKLGSLCFIGRWDAKAGMYRWTAGQRTEISPQISWRGLMEPDAAELTDVCAPNEPGRPSGGRRTSFPAPRAERMGSADIKNDRRLLVVWRGSNTTSTPGRKWFCISPDGGKTLGPVAEWKYSDGSRFYSPSSYHRLIRHSASGKLYWIGNICAELPDGNSPRYPLVIGEVDEATAALKRDTITAIDDRSPEQSPALQLSNFSVFENRETHNLQMYLTKYGQAAQMADWATADSYQYTLTLR